MRTKIINTQPILDYMQTHKMSKTAFCKFYSIGYPTLKKILEDNVLNMGIDKIFKIARAIKIHPKYLFVNK